MRTDRIGISAWTRRLGGAGLAVAVLVWIGGCSSDSELTDPGILTPSAIVVSNPVSGPAPAAQSGGSADVAGSRGVATVAYVSLAEGEIPTGTSASIRNWRTGTSVVTPMLAGGFDPLAVEATAGDTLEVAVEMSSGPSPLSFLLRVPLHAPPIVVRTEPADGKRDVPLNARIIIVFSEPIDGTTLTGTTIRLKRGFTVVDGEVRVADAGQLTAEFVPDEPLAPTTDYELMVTQGVKDQDGEPLEAAVGVAFTTSSASATRLVFTVQPSDADEGSSINPAVEVTVQDALGNVVTTFTDSIWVGLTGGVGSVSLAGTTRVGPVGGVAIFGDLQVVGGGGIGIKLVALSARAAMATSDDFQVTDTSSSMAAVYERETPHSGPTFHSRYVLRDNGGFELQYGFVSDTMVYSGQYWRSGSRIYLHFDGGSQTGYEAYGILLGDSNLGIWYNSSVTIPANFEGGWYTSAPDTAAPPSSPPPPGQLAFVRDGKIYQVNTDGSGLVRLSDGPGDRDPAWSPDGQRIAFARWRGDSSDLFVMNANGSNLIRRTSGLCCHETPAWSPDGTRIAFAALGEGSSNVYVLPADDDGTGATAVVALPGYDTHPAWSPDGGKLAFVSDWRAYDFVYDVYIVDADTSGVTALIEAPIVDASSFGDFVYYSQPAWSPDGQRLAFVSGPDAWWVGSPSVVKVMNTDGSGVLQVALANGFARPTWAPDGQTIAFSSSGDIHWIKADGSVGGVVIADGHRPAWRP